MRYLMLLVLLASSMYPCHAQHRVDVMQFDLVGVKLGMTEKEVNAQLVAHGFTRPPYGSYLASAADDIYNRKLPERLEAKKGDVTVIVQFAPRVPVDRARPEAVFSVQYLIPDTPANGDAIVKAAYEKFGAPTIPLDKTWCLSPGRVNCMQTPQAWAKVASFPAIISLQDDGLKDRIRQYWDAQHAVKPKL